MHINTPADIKGKIAKERAIRWAAFIMLLSAVVAVFVFVPAVSGQDNFTKTLELIFFVGITVIVTGVPVKVWDRSWQGVVIDSKVETDWDNRMMGSQTGKYGYRENTVYIVVKKANGKTIRQCVEGKQKSHIARAVDRYEIGDYAVHVGGAKYTALLKVNQERYRCVMCGDYSPLSEQYCES